MSTFEIRTVQLEVADHPNADKLDIVKPVGTEFVAVAQKGRFKTGDYAVYVPESAVVPSEVLKAAGFWDDEKEKGMLAGTKGDRVKPVKLRGVVSQGILINLDIANNLAPEVTDGNYSDVLGIVKYEPPVPTELSGSVVSVHGLHSYTDIENAKNYPDVLVEGEQVVVTEKLHGTCSIFTLVKDESDPLAPWIFHVSSKGLAKRSLAIREAEGNAYWRMARHWKIEEALSSFVDAVGAKKEFTLFGETIGVQDLMYGLDKGQLDFQAFDLRVDGEYLPHETLDRFCNRNDIAVVPLLYVGEFNADVMKELAEGKSTIADNVREGVIVRPILERKDDRIGRVILKFVGDGYLTRKAKNATEYE